MQNYVSQLLDVADAAVADAGQINTQLAAVSSIINTDVDVANITTNIKVSNRIIAFAAAAAAAAAATAAPARMWRVAESQHYLRRTERRVLLQVPWDRIPT
jgi:copper chaperone CopZ